VVNDCDERVLLLDGEELIGAKQNRVLNLTILVGSKSTIVIPVSCVEAGRWSHATPEFRPSKSSFYAAGRAMKTEHVSSSLRSHGSRHSNQGAVWDSIAEKAVRMAAASPTSAMSEIFTRHETGLADYVKAFAAAPGQVGAAFSINGKLIGMDLFDCTATLAKLLPKLVRSYALDAIDAPGGAGADSSAAGGIGPAAAGKGAVEDLLQRIAAATVEEFKAVGEGQDLRFRAAGLTGAALADGDRIVHLCAFQLQNHSTQEGHSPITHFSRPSARRTH